MHNEIKCIYFKQLCTLFVYLMTAVNGDNGNINCPRFCKCDSYLQLNRAQCSSKNLISAEIDLLNQVQVLDLSYNDITIVDNNCFVNYSHLKYLNLSNNALHTLDWDAFAKLRRLTEVDLSYNRLEYLDERLFAENENLNKINLEGNKFESLQNKPLIINPFITELNLRNSQLNFLQPQLFAGLENLQYLDLSKNLLNNFNVEDFQHLPKLKYLNLNENFIKCDRIIKDKIKQLQIKGVNVALDECSTGIYKNDKHRTQIMEKLIMAVTTNDKEDLLVKTSPWRLNIEEENDFIKEYDEGKPNSKEIIANAWNSNDWFRFSPNDIICNMQNFVLCQEYISCLQELNNAQHEKHKFKEQCPINDVKFAFVMGIAIGIATIVIILACALCVKRSLKTKETSPPNDDIEDFPSSQPLARPTNQLPPHVRRQPRRRTTRPARSLVRYEGPVTENFLSRLFGRPARHQYYRTINQNTATLIRRLSRSNLFNNRLSQHFIDRQTSSEIDNPEVQDATNSAPRSETPPPSYSDVVVKNLSSAH